MNNKDAIKILRQQRAYWSYDIPDKDKMPPSMLRKDLVDAIDVALKYIPEENLNAIQNEN